MRDDSLPKRKSKTLTVVTIALLIVEVGVVIYFYSSPGSITIPTLGLVNLKEIRYNNSNNSSLFISAVLLNEQVKISRITIEKNDSQETLVVSENPIVEQTDRNITTWISVVSNILTNRTRYIVNFFTNQGNVKRYFVFPYAVTPEIYLNATISSVSVENNGNTTLSFDAQSFCNHTIIFDSARVMLSEGKKQAIPDSATGKPIPHELPANETVRITVNLNITLPSGEYYLVLQAITHSTDLYRGEGTGYYGWVSPVFIVP